MENVHQDPPKYRFRHHDLVTKRDGDGTVGFVLSERPTLHAGENWYLVQFGASRENCRDSDLRPHIEAPDLGTLLSTDSYGGPDAFRRHVTAVKLKTQLTDTLYSYGASRTQLHPYQFVPLLKFLSSPYRRILIADEVGLGKTIEAAYILQEELARGRSSRVLIVCPASLRLKWHDELFTRFNHRFDILDASSARQRIPISDGERRSAHPLRGIVSLQSIRSDRFTETILSSPAPLDLLIVDEAHHCRNAKTLQAQAVSSLVEQADSVVFLTATPIQTSELNLFSLLNILVPEEFPSEAGFRQRLRVNQPIVEAETILRQQGADRIKEAHKRLSSLYDTLDGTIVTANPLFDDMMRVLASNEPDSAWRRVELQEQLQQLNLLSNIFTRTKRRDVHLNIARRKAIIPEASLTNDEQEAYDVVSDFIFEEYQKRHGDGAARLVLTTYQRQLASSIPAAIRKFRTAIESSSKMWDDEIETTEDESKQTDEADVKYRPIDDPAFRDIILGIDVANLELQDTKYSLLLESLCNQRKLADAGERTSRKTIVFSYFRRSLDYLEQRLGRDGFSLVRIDGSVKSTPQNPETDERFARISRFRDDSSIDLMLTSEVGSEGLDFQFCDAMVNWDLPWNPMVIEQRIGRIDRIGQVSPQILIVNLACVGTIEARILHRLYERIGIFEHSIGELEPILGDVVRDLEEELFQPRLSIQQQEKILHAQEIAIETRRRHQQSLEQQAELLIGHDEFFRSKLDRIRRFGRYVGGPELRLFVENELKTIAPGLEFVQDDRPGLYSLAYRSEVERLIDNNLPRGNEEGLRFLDRYRRGAIRFAFDGEIADRYAEAEPLHAQHPLVRALSIALGDDIVDKPQVASLSVESTAVSSGPWFFLWALVVETGFLAARSLLCCVIDLHNDDLRFVDTDAGDELLADMLRMGKPWADFNPPDHDAAKKCLEAGESRIRDRVDDLHSKRQARMEAIKSARRGTVDATFRIKIERQRDRVRQKEYEATYKKEAQRILPAFRGKLQQLEAERDVQIERVDSLTLGTVTYTLLGAGFVDVRYPRV